MRNPARPLDTLRNLHAIRREEAGTDRMKLAMIGDRETKDLRPPEELLADRQTHRPWGLVTIRLLSGRYAKDSREDPDRREAGHPQFLAPTLAHVKAILLSRDTWKDIPCLQREPSLFNWGVDCEHPTRIPADPEDDSESIGIDYLLEGMSMPSSKFPVISSICATFLAEYVGRCSNERVEILNQLFRSSRDPVGAAAMVKRGARIAAFVLAGALADPTVSAADERRFVKELAECKKSRLPRKKGAPAWFMERVLNALNWLRNNARDQEARRMANEALS
jgi:hypothetical protein